MISYHEWISHGTVVTCTVCIITLWYSGNLRWGFFKLINLVNLVYVDRQTNWSYMHARLWQWGFRSPIPMESHFAKFKCLPKLPAIWYNHYEHNIIRARMDILTANKHIIWFVQQSLNRIYYTDTHAYKHTHTYYKYIIVLIVMCISHAHPANTSHQLFQQLSTHTKPIITILKSLNRIQAVEYLAWSMPN